MKAAVDSKIVTAAKRFAIEKGSEHAMAKKRNLSESIPAVVTQASNVLPTMFLHAIY